MKIALNRPKNYKNQTPSLILCNWKKKLCRYIGESDGQYWNLVNHRQAKWWFKVCQRQLMKFKYLSFTPPPPLVETGPIPPIDPETDDSSKTVTAAVFARVPEFNARGTILAAGLIARFTTSILSGTRFPNDQHNIIWNRQLSAAEFITGGTHTRPIPISRWAWSAYI